MKKQVKKIVFVGIVVVLLLLAWLILEKIIPEDAGEETIKIMDLDARDYSMVGIVEPGEAYKYYIVKEEPAADAGADAEPAYYFWDNGIYDDMNKYGYYEPYNMEKVFERTTTLTALELVDEKPTDYAQYGLDADSATVVMGIPYETAEDAPEFTILIGDRNKVVTGEGYYCRVVIGSDVEATPEVYLISTLDGGTFLGGAEYFQTTNILPNMGTYFDEIRTLTFTNRAGETMEFKRFTKFKGEEFDELIYTNFSMVSPYSCYVSDEIIGAEMLEEITNTQVVQVVAVAPTEEEYEKYGFNNSAKLEFSLASGDATYYIGAPSGAGSGVYYVMVEGFDTIYLCYGDASFIDFSAMEFRSGLAWIHDIRLAGQLDITTPDGSYTVIMDDTVDAAKGTGTWIAQIIDHQTGVQSILSETNGRALYTDCIAVKYDELVVSEDSPIIEDEPSYTITLKYKDFDFTSKVSFYKVTSRQYAVLFDDAPIDTAGFTVNVVKLKEIADDLRTITSGGVISE